MAAHVAIRSQAQTAPEVSEGVDSKALDLLQSALGDSDFLWRMTPETQHQVELLALCSLMMAYYQEIDRRPSKSPRTAGPRARRIRELHLPSERRS